MSKEELDLNSPSKSSEENVWAVMKGFVEKLAANAELMRRIVLPINQSYRPNEKLLEWLEELPSLSKSAMAAALKRGWFFGWSMSLDELAGLIKGLERADGSEIDRLLSEHHRNYFDHHRNLLLDKYPVRSNALRAACNAHESGGDGFFLSVPVFLAQADGVLTEFLGLKKSALGVDKTDKPVAGGTRAKLATTKITELLKDRPDALALVHPIAVLKELHLLEGRHADEELYESYLNRHSILHGENSSYGTEMISLKAFAFLCHVGLHVPNIVEEFEETKDLDN